MNTPFEMNYSEAYDLLYHDKNYRREVELIQSIFDAHGKGRVKRILDLGSGTGSHAIALAQRDFLVVGVDRSESMLTLARRKAGRLPEGTRPEFRQGDIRTVRVPGRFDAVLMMFAVLGYQITDEDVTAALKAARGHLDPGGLLIFDVWYGPAVVRERPAERNKVVHAPDADYHRSATGELDEAAHVCTVSYTLRKMNRGNPVSESKEVHRMRYFFGEELEDFLKESGYEPIRIGAFPEIDREPDDTTWNIMVAARAV